MDQGQPDGATGGSEGGFILVERFFRSAMLSSIRVHFGNSEIASQLFHFSDFQISADGIARVPALAGCQLQREHLFLPQANLR